jgi:hypothetical protein
MRRVGRIELYHLQLEQGLQTPLLIRPGPARRVLLAVAAGGGRAWMNMIGFLLDGRRTSLMRARLVLLLGRDLIRVLFGNERSLAHAHWEREGGRE